MILKPCLHCTHRGGCPIKADKLSRLKASGVKLSSASFRCGERWKGAEIGREVTLRLCTHYGPEDGGDSPVYSPAVKGVIVSHLANGKVGIWLDESTSQGHVKVRVNPDYGMLTFLDSFRDICPECDKPAGVALRDVSSWYCDRCGVPTNPNDQEEDSHEA